MIEVVMACFMSVCLPVSAWERMAIEHGCSLEDTDFGYVIVCDGLNVIDLEAAE